MTLLFSRMQPMSYAVPAKRNDSAYGRSLSPYLNVISDEELEMPSGTRVILAKFKSIFCTRLGPELKPVISLKGHSNLLYLTPLSFPGLTVDSLPRYKLALRARKRC